MTPKAILFDFDGTIADTVKAGVVIFNNLAHKYGFREITEENKDMLRAKGPREVMKELNISMLRVPTVLRALRSGIKDELPTLSAYDGIRSVTLTLKEKGYQLGIVTSNSDENVRSFLKHNDMECFDWLQTGAGIFSKATAIKKLIVRENLQNYQLAFVGDEIRDAEAAKKNGILAVSVTWGLNSHAGLLRANPGHIVDNADELLNLLLSLNS